MMHAHGPSAALYCGEGAGMRCLLSTQEALQRHDFKARPAQNPLSAQPAPAATYNPIGSLAA